MAFKIVPGTTGHYCPAVLCQADVVLLTAFSPLMSEKTHLGQLIQNAAQEEKTAGTVPSLITSCLE